MSITWEDFWPSVYIYLSLQILLEDMVVPLALAMSLLVLNTTFKRAHRSKALFDRFVCSMTGDHFHVEKNRSFKFDSSSR